MFVYENRISITIIFYEHCLANMALNLEARFNPCEFYNIPKTRIAFPGKQGQKLLVASLTKQTGKHLATLPLVSPPNDV